MYYFTFAVIRNPLCIDSNDVNNDKCVTIQDKQQYGVTMVAKMNLKTYCMGYVNDTVLFTVLMFFFNYQHIFITVFGEKKIRLPHIH